MGEWEQSALVDTEAKRGNGRCFYFGCEEPGFIRATWMAPTPTTTHPDYVFCPRHADYLKKQLEEDRRLLALYFKQGGLGTRTGWEKPPSKAPRRSKRYAQRYLIEKAKREATEAARQAELVALLKHN